VSGAVVVMIGWLIEGIVSVSWWGGGGVNQYRQFF